MKNLGVQILRATAIAAVICIHTCPKGIIQCLIRPFINFGVPLFLFLSGYLTIPERIQSIPKFYSKRIIRVLLPYLIWTLIYSLSNEFTIRRFISNLLFARATYTLYYVFVYIQLVLLTPLLLKLSQSSSHWLGWLITPLSLFAIQYPYSVMSSGLLCNESISIIWSVCCLPWITYYYMGLFLGNYGDNKILAPDSYWIVLAIVTEIAEGYFWYKCGYIDCGTPYKFSSLITNTIVLLYAYHYLIHNPITTNRWIISIGDYSFGIYLVHPLILSYLSTQALYIKMPFPICSVILLAITYGLVVLGHKVLGERISKVVGFA